MLFHRKEEKYRLSLTDKEYRLLLDCLMIRRNKLLAEGRYTDAIDEVLLTTQLSRKSHGMDN